MISSNGIEIDAPATRVWDVYADVEQWASWTASIERIVALDGPGLAVGKRFEVKQPRFPKLVWEVTEHEAGASWTWRQRSFGNTTYGVHEVTALSPERTLVNQRIDQRGPLGAAVGLLMRGLTRRYLDLEARGLKVRCEEQQGPHAAST